MQEKDIIDFAVAAAKSGDRTLAIKTLSSAKASFVKSAPIHGFLAWFLFEENMIEPAIAYARYAAQLAPHSERCSLVLFHILWAADERDSALLEAKRFIESYGYSTEYARVLEQSNSTGGKQTGSRADNDR